MRVGLPRTFVHYASDIDWAPFLKALGHEVVYSTQTAPGRMSRGQRYCNNDDCLPMKHFYGHVLDLSQEVDCLFIPQLVRQRPGTNCCPKVIAMPYLVKNCVPGLVPILIPSVDADHPLITKINLIRVALKLSRNPKKIRDAVGNAMKQFQRAAAQPSASGENLTATVPATAGTTGSLSKPAIGLLGHKYSLKDRVLNLDLVKRIKEYGYRVVTPDQLVEKTADPAIFGCRQLHWDCGRKLVNAAGRYLEDPGIAGVISITFFGCGVDAFVEEVYREKLCRAKPYLSLTLDEHTGEAGMVTRLEAFFDMMARRSQDGC